MTEPYRMRRTTGIALTVLAALPACLPGVARAQEASESRPLVLRVRPSGYDTELNEAQMRQERLLRKLEKSDHMVRSICVNCGDEWKHQIYAPFYPMAALNGSIKPVQEPGEAPRVDDRPKE